MSEYVREETVVKSEDHGVYVNKVVKLSNRQRRTTSRHTAATSYGGSNRKATGLNRGEKPPMQHGTIERNRKASKLRSSNTVSDGRGDRDESTELLLRSDEATELLLRQQRRGPLLYLQRMPERNRMARRSDHRNALVRVADSRRRRVPG